MLSANSLRFNHCSGSFPLYLLPWRSRSVVSVFVEMHFIGDTFFLLPLHYTRVSPFPSPWHHRGHSDLGTEGRAASFPSHFPPSCSPVSHFGRALMEKERGIFIAHAALCMLSLAFVFPRYTCVYPQPFSAGRDVNLASCVESLRHLIRISTSFWELLAS